MELGSLSLRYMPLIEWALPQVVDLLLPEMTLVWQFQLLYAALLNRTPMESMSLCLFYKMLECCRCLLQLSIEYCMI
jgi:hypothetical protein